MLTMIDRFVKQACATDRFETRRQVLTFAFGLTIAVTAVADILNLASHYILHVLGLLPYDFVQAATVGLIISTLVASALTFTVTYVIGLAIHHLTISRATFERLSRTDMLSGLLNRRAFLHEVSMAPSDSSLVLFDIDRFKAVNDVYGHDVGDRVIIAVAAKMAEVFQDEHLIARIGGEEFAILIVKLTSSERVELAERCRQTIERQPILLDTEILHVTVSGGVAEKDDYRSYEALFKACDQALYMAKASGRNCILHTRDLSSVLPPQKALG